MEAFFKISSMTIYKAWTCYNALFDYLSVEKHWLSCKHASWKQELGSAVNAALKKFKKYYSQTEGDKRPLFNLACVLNPSKKLDYYKTSAFGK